MRNVIEFTVPLPPAALRSNSRAFWGAKKAAKVKYSEAVAEEWFGFDWCTRSTVEQRNSMPWKQARVTYTWRYCGVAPDRQNLGANLKALTDILCCAPNTGLQRNDTTYLGLVEDDKGVEPVYELERVKTRAETGVVIRIERL